MNLAFFLVSFLCSRSRVLCFSRVSLRQGTEKSTGRVNAGRINFFRLKGTAKKMNASPVDFTAAPAAYVFPRKALTPEKTGRGKYTRKKPEASGSNMATRGVNKVILVGNLGQDPEVRYMPNGGAVANLTLATSESWRDKQDGEIREHTEWHRVVVFGKLAEIASEYLRKGAQVYIEGQLRTRKWTDQSGQDKYTTEVIVGQNGTMQMLGRRDSQPPQGGQPFSGQPQPQTPTPAAKGEGKAPKGAGKAAKGKNAAAPQQPPAQPDPAYDFDDSIPF